MAGTKEGGAKACATNKEKYGPDFYKRIGAAGGVKTAADGAIKGFAAMPREKRVEAGRKGGTISRKGKAKVNG